MFSKLRKILIGKPLHNEELAQERMPVWKALPIFSSDALSSVGYGPEQIVLILSIPGAIAYGFIGPVAIAILLLLILITISYVQVAKANPGGGGSYAVAKENLGEIPALVAASSLFTDYVLTVAVSISSGTAAIASAFPSIYPYMVELDLVVLFGILMLVNLRGTRESSTFFVLPTYTFLFGILMLIAVGIYQAFTGIAPVIPQASMEYQWNMTMIFLALRAFSSGCSSMTGVEAISNGVTVFKKPEVENATKTTYYMSILLGIMFAGLSFLIIHHHIMPVPEITVLSQIAEKTVDRGFLYYYIQITTMLVLYLAANTSFNGLPPLLSILARDGYMPRYLANRGDRLAFSNGIILLSLAAGFLIFVFQGNVEHLIALYAVGVFLSFTISQVGMVRHWQKLKDTGWLWRALLNGLGAFTTAIVVLIIMVTKFIHGAWMVLVFIPIMIYIFKKIHSHYHNVADELRLTMAELNEVLAKKAGRNYVIVPIDSPTIAVAEALKYARSLSSHVTAIHISTDDERAKKIESKWEALHFDVRLIIIDSPYRQITEPLLNYVNMILKQKEPGDYVTVLIPEFETCKWWHRLLHNQTGWILHARLVMKDDVVVTTLPYHLTK